MDEVEVFIFKFRSSSHSDDYTVVATYKSEKQARKVYRKLEELFEDLKKNSDKYEVDWAPDEAYHYVNGRTVGFGVDTGGCLDEVEDIMDMRNPKPEKYGVYTNYQELTIIVEVPKGLTVEAAMLVMPEDEGGALRELRWLCGEPKVEEEDEHDQLIFEYEGDGVYDEGENTLRVGGVELGLSSREHWKVEEV